MNMELFLILWSYLLLSKSRVDSYVLFAANIDDFRSIANKIIPGQLADQLANMANKQDKLNYRHDVNEPVDESSDESVKDNSDVSTENSDYSESFYKTSSPVKIEKARFQKKYIIQNENIDLDELVKRVKERLETDYKVTTAGRNEAYNNPSSIKPMETDGKLEDYYYKDEEEDLNTNVGNGGVETSPLGSAFTTEQTSQYPPQYDGENIDYDNYNPVTAQQQKLVQVVTPQEVRDGNKEQAVKKLDEYGSIIQETVQSYKKEDENVPKYSKNISERPNEVNIYQPETNVQRDTQTNIKEVPEYYDNNADNAQNETTNDNGYFKEVNMLQSTNDSYEDYVTPKRDLDNIFDSGEPITTQQNVRPSSIQNFVSVNMKFQSEQGRVKAFADPLKITKESTIKEKVVKVTRKVSAITPQPEFIRAKTARMWYKDPNIENYDDSTKKIKENAIMKTTKKRLRTMFPTKMHIKISSPNYFAKLPAVAEKYDFNEPIPEKDREPELIKHIGNPPAMINKKVRI